MLNTFNPFNVVFANMYNENISPFSYYWWIFTAWRIIKILLCFVLKQMDSEYAVNKGSFEFNFVIHWTFIDHLLCDELCANIWVTK